MENRIANDLPTKPNKRKSFDGENMKTMNIPKIVIEMAEEEEHKLNNHIFDKDKDELMNNDEEYYIRENVRTVDNEDNDVKINGNNCDGNDDDDGNDDIQHDIYDDDGKNDDDQQDTKLGMVREIFTGLNADVDNEKIPRSSTFDLSVDKQPDEFYQTLDNIANTDLNFKGHTPLPSESDEEDEVQKEQCEKLLSFEHQFALPITATPKFVHHQPFVKNEKEHNFSERDFSRHRQSHKGLSGISSQIIETKKKRKHKSRHSLKKKEDSNGIIEKENESPLSKCNDLDNTDSPKDRPRSQSLNNRILSKILPQISETKELSDEETSSRKRSTTSFEIGAPPPTEVPTRQQHHRHHHHRRHQHARHKRSRTVNAQDDLELRIKTGMQKLEEERKAYQGALAEIEEDVDPKDIEDITSHRFGNYQNHITHRSQRKRYVKSGMTTHISSDVDSVHSFKPHMKIEMEEDQLQLAPREGFVELEELTRNENNELQWKERARWIKFEEDVEKNERWGKPHVASLSFQSLLELRRGIETGSVLLSLNQHNLPAIFESVVENMVITDQLTEGLKDRVIGILLSKHCHHHQQNANARPRRFSLNFDSFHKAEGNGTIRNDAQEVSETDLCIMKETNLSVGTPKDDSALVLEWEDNYANYMDNQNQTKPTVHFAPQTEDPAFGDVSNKGESDVREKIPVGAEATSVLVGTLDELSRPAMAFVRLAEGVFLENLTEVRIPIRFLFIILGPPSNHDYYEIGRSVATLMSDKVFHDLAYEARSRHDLLAAINSFLDDSIVLAPGDWDRHLLLPLLQAEISEKRRERIKLLKEKAQLDHALINENPFSRTGNCFGGLKEDIKKKAKHYASDFKDGLNWRCIVTIIFVFFATLAPTITFGALLSKKTENSLGIIETLLATSICGVIFSLTSGQPLIIVGTTGPILVFEEATYKLCTFFKIDFMLWRCWVGLFVMVILFAVVGFELCYLVEHFTRFTEEVFSVLISLLFIYECFYFLKETFGNHPIKGEPPDFPVSFLSYSYHNDSNISYNSIPKDIYEHYKSCFNDANIGLISLLLVLGTFAIAHWLRKLRCSHIFSSKARRVLSDFGVPIAMLVMVGTNLIMDVDGIPKIQMPDSFRPTKEKRKNFYVNPLEQINIVYIIFSIPVACCVSILLFMETELTGVLLNKRKNKLKKGGGYNLDLFVMGLLTGICSLLGLPWMCAATVRSVQHQNALAIMSRSHAPGERPYLLHIKEQRLTNLFIHILIGFCILGSPLLQVVPSSVCYGVFMYLGISSLNGIQFIEQLRLIFVPMKYHPNKKYVRCVRFRTLVTYTLIQVICLLLLIGIKLSPAAPAFPFVIICMVFLRRFIERYYTEEELEDLDNEDDDDEIDDDEYGIGLPM